MVFPSMASALSPPPWASCHVRKAASSWAGLTRTSRLRMADRLGARYWPSRRRPRPVLWAAHGAAPAGGRGRRCSGRTREGIASVRRSASSSALHVAGGGRDGPPGAGLERCGTGDEGTQASGVRARCSRSRPGQSRECARPRSSWRRGRRCCGNGPDRRRSPAKVVGGRSALASREPGGAGLRGESGSGSCW